LLADISALGNDLMVTGEEFGDWDSGRRRIDLLCLDKMANLVVVEIKRTEDGGHMELQAIRYAAMVASMTLERVIDTYARRFQGDDANQRAATEVLEFLEVDSVDEIELTGDVRIILVSGDFSPELVTAVIYLNKHDLDITCIRLHPYKLGDTLLIDVSQIIPLPEAADYEVKVREQEQEVRKGKTGRHEIFRKFWSQLIERSKDKTPLLANRTASSDHWLQASIGRKGFWLSLSLTKDQSSVACNIRDPNKPDAWNTQAFEALRSNNAEIEQIFGASLNWEDLPKRKSCRISFDIDGGWKIPPEDWPEHQEKLIVALIRLDEALRPPIQRLPD
jgi:hypothetical protein